MANIMINGLCNLKCSYCFVDDINIKCNMTIENVMRAVDFIYKDNTERLGIIGGEPTLHPELKSILKAVSENERVKEVVLFTNGILLDNYWEELKNKKVNVLVNCNSAEIMPNGLYKKMLNNIVEAAHNKMDIERIAIGINIYDSHMDYAYIFEVLSRSGIKKLRLSVAVPNRESDIIKDPLLNYGKMRGIIYEIICEALKRGVQPHFDCNLMPKCVFSSDEKNTIKQLGGTNSNLLSKKTICSPVIDILPDLTAVRCFGIGETERVPIDKFNNIDDLRNYFSFKYDDHCYITIGSEKCKNCYERVVKKCSGGCLAYKKSEIEKFLIKGD